ncbi:Hypothetical predicted protein [Octopus vulgaris]|uniref:Uncharacterized protein n=3 Tax=Octopus TaxID=6643 RepID=A0AA36BJ06_OCTVU|nr:integrator complex subunit 3 isoform X2 [Octopus sinensis]CAI9735301.1 Hypothetical predicted protein [Octopus vulgaris]
MEKEKNPGSRLIFSSVLEPKDDLEEKCERFYAVLTSITNGLSERECNDALNAHVGKGPNQHEEIQLGQLYAILVEPKMAAKMYRDMTLVSRDGMVLVQGFLGKIIHDKWLKILQPVKVQILWLMREFVKNAVVGSDGTCFALIRQIAGGDVSPKNLWLAEQMLDLLSENRAWLERFPTLMAASVYTYLRIIIDHGNPAYANLRNREVEFCVSLLRDKFIDCVNIIGRDLARVLQNVARIPEFEKLWRDIMYNPTSLNPNFTGIVQLLQARSSRRLLMSRLTPDMENKLMFLTTKVKFGQHKRYQDWFQRQYLSTPESQSLRCDLIRYICAVFHPTNELLCSEIIPRWAVIGWLLTTCTSNVAASNVKLSLFYDWLLFDPDKDSIMNIEPAILVMYHSMRPHPVITATLLDFMCRVMPNFCPSLSVQVRQGIYTSLRSILEKRVLQSLSPLFDNPKLDKELRALIRENFIEFCSPDIVKEEASVNKDLTADVGESGNHIVEMSSLSDGVFSDDEDDIPLGKLVGDTKIKPFRNGPRFQPIDITEHIQLLQHELRQLTIELQNETDQEVQCEIIDKLVQHILRDEDFDQDMASTLAICLCQILGHLFMSNLFPQEVDEESIEDSIGTPLFVIFRNFCSTAEEDPIRQPLLFLMDEMYQKQPHIGYHMLYFLKVSKVNDDKMSSYRDFCKSLDGKDLESCLMNDLRICQEDDVRLFTYLLPDIYTHFPNIVIGNTELLQMIVSCIDAVQLQDLICQILQGHLIMFRKDSFLYVLNASLEWETIEQYFLWQLITAHSIPVEHIMPVLPKLEFCTHSEALASIMILLKQECPTAELLRPLMCREYKKQDLFTVSVMKNWAHEYEDRLAELLYNLLAKSNSTPKKRQRNNSAKRDNMPTPDQVLAHLDHMRVVCRNVSFLNHESMQHALQQVQMTASEVQKTKYSDLLALAEDFDDMKTTRVLRGRRTRDNSSTKVIKVKKEETESEASTSEEEDVKPKPKKRKKGSATTTAATTTTASSSSATSAAIDEDSD